VRHLPNEIARVEELKLRFALSAKTKWVAAVRVDKVTTHSCGKTLQKALADAEEKHGEDVAILGVTLTYGTENKYPDIFVYKVRGVWRAEVEISGALNFWSGITAQDAATEAEGGIKRMLRSVWAENE